MVTPEELKKYLEVLQGTAVTRVKLGDLELELRPQAASLPQALKASLEDLADDEDDDEKWLFAATEGYPRPGKNADQGTDS